MNTIRIFAVATTAMLLLAGCSGNGQFTGIADPLCMPDGSPVWVQYPNNQGSFEAAVASRENCPWHSPKSGDDS